MASNKFGDALKEAAEKLKEKQAEQAEQMKQNSLVLQKPTEQVIGDTSLRWTWRTEAARICAYYYTQDSIDSDGRVAGEFEIEVNMMSCSDTYYFDVRQAKEFAEALYSAQHWESVWQQHVGEFIAVQPKQQRLPEPYLFDENGNGQ